MQKRLFFITCLVVMALGGCQSTQETRGWYALKWIEKPSADGPSKSVPANQRTYFQKILTYSALQDDFNSTKSQLREGDVIAYYMNNDEINSALIKGNLNTVGYKVLDYGHLAILAKSEAQDDSLVLFSSQAFKGPNTDEDIDTLKDHHFDVYRLNKWDSLDHIRFYEFIAESKQKAGAWYGYDFSGMAGLWNSSLMPDRREKIGHDYICSTVVGASLYYSGLELDAIQRYGLLDLVTPKQIVSSQGRLIEVPNVELAVETHTTQSQ